jgi:hypothetical protein
LTPSSLIDDVQIRVIGYSGDAAQVPVIVITDSDEADLGIELKPKLG